ncbi:hypothetical protein ACVA51_10935 [Pseudomonas luteola]
MPLPSSQSIEAATQKLAEKFPWLRFHFASTGRGKGVFRITSDEHRIAIHNFGRYMLIYAENCDGLVSFVNDLIETRPSLQRK